MTRNKEKQATVRNKKLNEQRVLLAHITKWETKNTLITPPVLFSRQQGAGETTAV